jgi:hypothetical protein
METMQTRHVGWNARDNHSYYDPSVIAWISNAVTAKTAGLDVRPIRVTDEVIKNVLDNHLINYRAFPGDIHTRYNIPGDGNFSGDFGQVRFRANQIDQYLGSVASSEVQSQLAKQNVGFSSNVILNEVVEFMAEYIKTEYQMIANNKGYSAWSALYGANDLGMRAHAPIKLQERRPTPFQFHMKY